MVQIWLKLKFVFSERQFTTLDVLQSSAYNAIVFLGIATSGKSLMKIIKNIGSNKDPWGKPEGMTDQVKL